MVMRLLKIMYYVIYSKLRKGIRLANDICKNHRRKGLYSDEIMEGIVNGQA